MSLPSSKDSQQALVINARSREKDLVAKMRKKLAFSQAPPEPAAVPLSPRAARRKRERLTRSLWVAGFAMAAMALNIFALMHKNRILENLGIRQEQVLARPAAEESADQQALFWAYAAYAAPEFHTRYAAKGTLVDPEDAAHHVKILWSKVSSETRSRIRRLQKAAK